MKLLIKTLFRSSLLREFSGSFCWVTLKIVFMDIVVMQEMSILKVATVTKMSMVKRAIMIQQNKKSSTLMEITRKTTRKKTILYLEL